METLFLDYIILSETKIDQIPLTDQFKVIGYEISARRDRDNGPECLFSELTFNKKKWICFRTYRPPESSNLLIYSEELTIASSKAILQYENLFIMGDFVINLKRKNLVYDELDEFCDIFILTNLTKSDFCL